MSTMYTKSGKPLTVSGRAVFNRDGREIGRINGSKVFDPDGRYVGTIAGGRLVYRSADSASIGSSFAASRRVGSALGSSVRSAVMGDEPDVQ